MRDDTFRQGWLLKPFFQCPGRFRFNEVFELEERIAYDPGAAWMSTFYAYNMLLSWPSAQDTKAIVALC